jgi:hypothetical protein
MAPFPYAERAILDIRKIETYCLNPAHPRGRHKARVFREALGLAQRDASWLRQALLDGVRRVEASELANDNFGVRWQADIPLARQDRRVVVRTIWIVRSNEEIPRFVTCWVL